MAFRLDEPVWLWGLAVIPPLILIGLRWFISMSMWRRLSAVFLRSLLIALLIAALAGASSVREVRDHAVVAIVDVSGSVRRYGPHAPGGDSRPITRLYSEFLSRAESRRGPDDLAGMVVFDGRSLAIATASHSQIHDRELDVSMAEGTNIAEAMRLGLALIPPDATGRLVLISDGVQTAGDAVDAARRLVASRPGAGAGRRAGVPVDVVPVDYSIEREVVVESLDLPPRAAAEAGINARVVLNASSPATGTLRLESSGRPVAIGPDGATGLRVNLQTGRNLLTIPVKLDAARIHRFRIAFEPDPGSDTVTENNASEAFTVTPGKGSVLLADGVSGGDPGAAGSTLARALREQGIQVTVVSPEAIPADVLSMQAFDLVLLQDVPAESVPPTTQEALAAFVRDLGGGLVMLGGPQSFGAGGWRGSVLEPLLPVRLDLPDKVVTSEVAVVMVIDVSGSMGRPVMGSGKNQQQVVNEAAALAARSLDKADQVGVVAFNNSYDVAHALARNVNPELVAQRILALRPGGGTNALPATEEAARQLAAADAKAKHIILLSDGVSQRANELPRLAARLKEQGINVSTIAVGDSADTRIMDEMARAGGGAFYNVVNPDVLPRIFLKAIRVVRTPMIREGEFTPVVLPTPSPLWAGLGQPPPLDGLTLTQARPEPTIINALATAEGEPVLAHWQVELGQVAAFTSDAHRWATPWLSWPGYKQFWTQLVRSMSRPPQGRAFEATTLAESDRVSIRVRAAGEDGSPMDFLSMPVTVFDPQGESRPLELSQVGPGVYEGSLPATRQGTYVALVRPRLGERRLAPFVTGATLGEGVEFRSLASDRATLEQIAQVTGGRVLNLTSPEAADLFTREGIEPTFASTLLWRPLLIAAMVVLMLDIATRRVAWDRWISREFGTSLAKSAAEAVRDRGGQAAKAIASLKTRAESAESRGETSAIALGEEDARNLAKAATDRRRAARLSAMQAAQAAADQPNPPAPSTTPPPDQDPTSASGLLAAKRRAAQRFEE